MAVTEIPNSGSIYRVQPLDKDQASQQDQFRRKKKEQKEEKAKKQESSPVKSSKTKGGHSRINLIV